MYNFSSILSNQAALGGGGLYCSDCGIQVMRQTFFARNNASLGGGGALQLAPRDLAALTGSGSAVYTTAYDIGLSAGVSFYDNAALFASSIASSTTFDLYYLYRYSFIYGCFVYILHSYQPPLRFMFRA